MARSIFRNVATAFLILATAGCDRENRAIPNRIPSPAPTTTHSTDDDITQQFDSIAKSLASAAPTDPEDDLVTAISCPKTDGWSKLETFAPACGYLWTKESAQLPVYIQWEPCDPEDRGPRSGCRKPRGHRKFKGFHAAVAPNGSIQLGFVEKCDTEQIVIADIDGPVHLALRAGANAPPNTCEMNLLAVGEGRWLGALGGSEIADQTSTSGYTLGGAFIGGKADEAPSVLFSQSKQPFHVASTRGDIVPEGWMADGKQRHWNGKPFDRPVKPQMKRLTDKLFVDARKGIYQKSTPEPVLIFPVSSNGRFDDFHRRDRRMTWREVVTVRGRQTCRLFAGELNNSGLLTSARRLTEIPCNTTKLVLGCDFALMDDESGMLLLSLVKGSSRHVITKGEAIALNCKEALVEHRNSILRIDISAFGPEKPPVEPPIPLVVQSTPKIADLDAGAAPALEVADPALVSDAGP